MRNPAKGVAAFMAVGMAAEMLHSSAPEIRKPTDAAIAAGQYACSLHIEDTHQPITNVAGAALRDRLIAHLHLTPQPAVAAYTSLYPQGSDRPGHNWYSPQGTAYVHTPNIQHPSNVPGYPLFTQSDSFHDDRSPTGDDLNPWFVIAPSETGTPPDQIDEVYLYTRVLSPASPMPKDGLLQTEGYTPCGAIKHVGQLQWQVESSAPPAQPFVYTKHLVPGQ